MSKVVDGNIMLDSIIDLLGTAESSFNIAKKLLRDYNSLPEVTLGKLTGTWKYHHEGYKEPYECSHCHIHANSDYKHCPNCGAEMANHASEVNKVTKSQGVTYTLPVPVGATVYVSPNFGRSFHTGKLYGINENGSYLVLVDDETTKYVEAPLDRAFWDWFAKIYTVEEVAKSLADWNDKTVVTK